PSPAGRTQGDLRQRALPGTRREQHCRQAHRGSGRCGLHLHHRCGCEQRPAQGDPAAGGPAAQRGLRRRGGHRCEEPGRRPDLHPGSAEWGWGPRAQGGRLQASPGLMRRAAFAVGLFLALFLVLAFLTLPIVAIFVHTSPRDLISSLGEQDARDALLLSLKTSLAALALIVIVETPAASL